MDPQLQKLIRQLQDEKCPLAVRDRVAQRIAREKAKTPARPLRTSLAWALSIACIACLVGAVTLWQAQARRESQRVAAEHAATRAHRALVVQQTQEAFGYLGQAFLRAASHTENALSKEALPPLRNGFEILKNKVTNPI